MSEITERVARALFKMFRSVPPQGEAWRDYLEDAKTVIEAMREPTEAMVLAGYDTGSPGFCDEPGENGTPAEVWDAMIDAALAQ